MKEISLFALCDENRKSTSFPISFDSIYNILSCGIRDDCVTPHLSSCSSVSDEAARERGGSEMIMYEILSHLKSFFFRDWLYINNLSKKNHSNLWESDDAHAACIRKNIDIFGTKNSLRRAASIHLTFLLISFEVSSMHFDEVQKVCRNRTPLCL